MSSDAFILKGTIDVDVKDAVNSLKKVDSGVKESGNVLDGFTSKLGGIAKGIAAAFSVKAIVDFGKKCLNAASDVEEMENKFNVVFDGMTEEVDSWADTFSDAIGRNKNEIKTYLADNQNMFVGMGMTREAGAEMSEQLVSLALDLASFNNLNEADAVEKMSKAIMGETESAKGLGAVLNDNTRAMAMEVLGYEGKFQSLTEAEKMQVNYQAILMQSTDAVGDAERSANSYANQIRRTKAKMEEFTQTLGSYFLPVATNVITAFGNMVDGAIGFVEKVADGMGKAREEFEATGEYTNALDVLIQEVFGVSMPDTFFYMVESIIGFFQTLWGTVVEIWNTVGVPIFEVITQVWNTLKDNSDIFFNAISTAFDIMTQAIKIVWETILKPVFDFVMEIVGVLGDYFEEHFGEMAAIFDEFVSIVKDFWERVLKPVLEAIGGFISNTLLPIFKTVFENGILPTIKNTFNGIKDLWDNSLKPIFTGIIDFVQGVFTGNWKQAWDGVVQALGGVWSGITSVIKAPLNAVIGLINSAINAMNGLSVSIPDWVPVVGGKSFGVNLPNISYLENGGILTQPTMLNSNVMAGEKNKGKSSQNEVVVPLDKLEDWIKEVAMRPVQLLINGQVMASATANDFDRENGTRLSLAGRGVLV